MPDDFDFDGDDPSPLRKKLAEQAAELKAEQEARAKAEDELKSVRSEQYLRTFGVDFERVEPAHELAIAQFSWDGDKPTDEAVAEFVSHWKLPTKQTATQTPPSETSDIARYATQGAGQGSQATSPDYSQAKNADEVKRMHDEWHTARGWTP